MDYFWLNKGPWSDLDEHKAFLPGVPERKPPGAAFYPPDMTREEFEAWVKTLSPQGKMQAEGFFTVIKRGPDAGSLPFPTRKLQFANFAPVRNMLRDAAKATDNATLKHFLETRAAAFLSNDYYASDVAWMDLDAPLDVTIGPYETYNDELFGYKAAFESYVNIRDDAETAKLKFFGDHMQEVENNLPIDAKYRNPKIGALSPIRVVNQVFAAGDGDHGVQDGRLQSAQRRTGGARKGQQARDAAQRAGGEVSDHADSNREGCAVAGGAIGAELRFFFHAHPGPRDESRDRPASDRGEWPRHQLRVRN